MELADAVAGSPLTHFLHLYPLIQMRVIPLHTGQGGYTVVATHCVNMVLHEEDKARNSFQTGFSMVPKVSRMQGNGHFTSTLVYSQCRGCCRGSDCADHGCAWCLSLGRAV